MKIGLIGYGYWGPKIARNLLLHKDCELKSVADLDIKKLQGVKEWLPEIQVTTQADDIFKDDSIDSVVISSYAHTHYQLTKDALLSGKHVLVEKPLSTSRKNGEELLNLADKKGLTLMVDHTYLYSNAILEIKKLLQTPGFENLRIIESNRSNFGIIRSDVNVLFDLATHDVAIITFLLGKLPVSVRANGFKLKGELEQIAQIYLTYENGSQASIYCSWISPHKIRKMNFVCDQKTICYDDMSADNKVEIFDYKTYWNRASEKDVLLDASVQKTSLYIKFEEPLFNMVGDFKNSVINRSKPRSDIALGVDVIRILEKACESLEDDGREILI